MIRKPLTFLFTFGKLLSANIQPLRLDQGGRISDPPPRREYRGAAERSTMTFPSIQKTGVGSEPTKIPEITQRNIKTEVCRRAQEEE